MWLNSRSRSNGHARTRLGGSLTGCDGTRSILITILPLLTHSGGGGQRRPPPPFGDCERHKSATPNASQGVLHSEVLPVDQPKCDLDARRYCDRLAIFLTPTALPFRHALHSLLVQPQIRAQDDA